MKITVTGVKELQSKLVELSKLNSTVGVTKGALRVERTAKEIVPVDTGNLRRSITHSVEGNRAVVGTSVEYAAKVELGIGQRSQPYLTPALNLNREQIKQDIIEDINRQLQEVAK